MTLSAQTIAQTPKKKSSAKKIIIWIIVIVLALLLLQSLSFFISPFALIAPLMKNLENKVNLNASQKNRSLVENKQSSVNLASLEGSGNLKIKPVDENKWPSGNVGGMYEIEPSGQTNGLVKVNFILKENPGEGFTLGYWYPDTKKWQRIPTVRRTAKVYEGYITHASYVVGSTVNTNESSINGSGSSGVAGSGDFRFRDAGLQRDWEQIQKDLDTLQNRQEQGTGGGKEDALWNSVGNLLYRMSDGVIANCKGKPSLEDRLEFLQVMSVSQLYGFESVNQKFYSAWSACIPLDKEVATSAYIVKQTDKIPFDFSFTGIGGGKGESTVFSDGVVIKSSGKYGWQGDWQVVQNTTTQTDSFVQLNFTGFKSSRVSNSANIKDLTMLLFSLEGVQQGQEFPIYLVRIGTYDQQTFGQTQDVIFYLNNEIFSSSQIKPNDRVIMEKGGLQIKGKLEADYKEDGALVSCENSMESIGGEQGEALKQIRKMAEQNPMLKQISDQMYSQSKNIQPIKLRIKRSGN